ncbi:Vacuolar membrane protein [Verticillium dahliae VDG2]|nr:Vacuolar membrane protein [Verticillium dahliae VDG2]
MPRPSLAVFLAQARAALTAPRRPNTPLTLVVGNESADLDSLCSAVLYAYLRSTTPAQPTLHIPLSNLPRADLALRPELTAALARARLRPSDLLTLDDLADTLTPESTRWVLVDHNALTGTLAARGFGSRVVGCGGRSAQEAADAGAAWLGLAAVLVDTAGLKAADKTTPRDVRAVEFLERLVVGTGQEQAYGRDAYLGELSRVKEDLSGMALRDVWRKDYKQWYEGGRVLGVSAVPQGLRYLIDESANGDQDGLLKALNDWVDERGLDVGVVMTTLHPGGDFQRELLVWAFSEGAAQAVEAFVKTNERELGLETYDDGRLDDVSNGWWRRAWKQRNVAHSRKRVGPMLREALKESPKL